MQNANGIKNMELKKIWLDFISFFLPMVKKYFSENWVGFVWFILTFLFALMIPFVISVVISPQYTFTKFLVDGDVALFSVVIVTSLMIDNFMFEEGFAIFLNNGKEPEYIKLFKRFMVFIFPLLIVIFGLIAYMGINMLEKKVNMFAVAIEIAVFFATASYAVRIKQLLWNKKKIL